MDTQKQDSAVEAGGTADREEALEALRRRLGASARFASGAEIEFDTFMAYAAQAYVSASPGLREQLESVRFLAELEALRKRGMVGAA